MHEVIECGPSKVVPLLRWLDKLEILLLYIVVLCGYFKEAVKASLLQTVAVDIVQI